MQKLCDLRNKKELQEYLLTNGLDASDETIEILREQYENKEKDDNVLTTQQLRDVAGGDYIFIRHISSEYCDCSKKNEPRYINVTPVKYFHANFDLYKPVPTGTYEYCIMKDDEKLHVILVNQDYNLSDLEHIPTSKMQELSPGDSLYNLAYQNYSKEKNELSYIKGEYEESSKFLYPLDLCSIESPDQELEYRSITALASLKENSGGIAMAMLDPFYSDREDDSGLLLTQTDKEDLVGFMTSTH